MSYKLLFGNIYENLRETTKQKPPAFTEGLFIKGISVNVYFNINIVLTN